MQQGSLFLLSFFSFHFLFFFSWLRHTDRDFDFLTHQIPQCLAFNKIGELKKLITRQSTATKGEELYIAS